MAFKSSSPGHDQKLRINAGLFFREQKKSDVYLLIMSWTYPDNLDALIAAPQNHKLLFENDRVRVLDTLIKPGDKTNLHTHRNPATHYVISWSDFIRYDEDGNVILDSRDINDTPKSGSAIWGEPLIPHTLKNIGTEDLHIISVELKS